MRSVDWVAYLLLEAFYISAAFCGEGGCRGMGKTRCDGSYIIYSP